MSRWAILWMVVGAAILGSVQTGNCDDARVMIVFPSAGHLLDKMEFLVKSSPSKRLRDEWPNIKDTLDSFLMGIDSARPLRFDFVIGDSAVRNIAVLPVSKLEGKKSDSLFENLDSFGYRVKAVPGRTGVYELWERGATTATSHLNYIEPSKTALLGEPSGFPTGTDPLKNVATLLGGADLAIDLQNDQPGIETRRKTFQTLRKQLEAGVKYVKGIDRTVLEFEKKWTEQQFNEAERFLAEIDRLSVTWTTDKGKSEGHGALSMTAFPGTDLQKSVDEFGTKSSYFAAVKLQPSPVFTGRLMFPVDEMRKKHLKEIYPLLKPAMATLIADESKLEGAQKEAAKTASETMVALLDANIELGLFDIVVDFHELAKDKHSGFWGVRAGQTQKVIEILELLPQIQPTTSVKIKAEEHKGVQIHEVKFGPEHSTELKAFYGSDGPVYFATNADSIWGAGGEKGLEELKAAIDQAAEKSTTPDPVILELSYRLGPGTRVWEVLASKRPIIEKAVTKEEKDKQKKQLNAKRLRTLALDAISSGDDLLKLELKKDGNKIVGSAFANGAILRLVGSVLGDFSKDFLN